MTGHAGGGLAPLDDLHRVVEASGPMPVRPTNRAPTPAADGVSTRTVVSGTQRPCAGQSVRACQVRSGGAGASTTAVKRATQRLPPRSSWVPVGGRNAASSSELRLRRRLPPPERRLAAARAARDSRAPAARAAAPAQLGDLLVAQLELLGEPVEHVVDLVHAVTPQGGREADPLEVRRRRRGRSGRPRPGSDDEGSSRPPAIRPAATAATSPTTAKISRVSSSVTIRCSHVWREPSHAANGVTAPPVPGVTVISAACSQLERATLTAAGGPSVRSRRATWRWR